MNRNYGLEQRKETLAWKESTSKTRILDGVNNQNISEISWIEN